MSRDALDIAHDCATQLTTMNSPSTISQLKRPPTIAPMSCS